MSWREHAASALRAAGPTKHDKQEALRRAGEEWRAMHGHRRNPSMKLGILALIGVAAFAAWKLVGPKPAATDAAGYGPDPRTWPSEPSANAPYFPYPQWQAD